MTAEAVRAAVQAGGAGASAERRRRRGPIGLFVAPACRTLRPHPRGRSAVFTFHLRNVGHRSPSAGQRRHPRQIASGASHVESAGGTTVSIWQIEVLEGTLAKMNEALLMHTMGRRRRRLRRINMGAYGSSRRWQR